MNFKNCNFKKLEKELIIDLKINNEKNIMDKINRNSEVIQTYLSINGDLKAIKNFVFSLNTIILDAKKNKYNLIKKILKHKAFTDVLKVFQNSDILVRACKEENKSAIKWLLTMKINSCVQDEYGKTALMYAAENSKLLFAVKKLVLEKESLNILDFNNENALFHATSNKPAFKVILNSKMINLSQLNLKNESILVYCCKYKHFDLIKYLIRNERIDINTPDNKEKTAVMYLAENGRYSELQSIGTRNSCDIINYRNRFNETALSLLIKNLYQPEHVSQCSDYYQTLIELVELGCDFNVPIDEDGNTAIMVFIMVQDFNTLNYVLKYGNDLDLSVQNYFGDDACSLYFNIPLNYQCKFVIEYSDKQCITVDNDDDSSIRMLILSSLSQSKRKGILHYGNEEKILDEDCCDYKSIKYNLYSDYKMMSRLESEAESIYNKKIKSMGKKDFSDQFSLLFILGLKITISILTT